MNVDLLWKECTKCGRTWQLPHEILISLLQSMKVDEDSLTSEMAMLSSGCPKCLESDDNVEFKIIKIKNIVIPHDDVTLHE